MSGSWETAGYFGWLRSVAEADAPPEVLLGRVAEELGKVEWLLAQRAANEEGSEMALTDGIRRRGSHSATVAQIASQEAAVGRAERDLAEVSERCDRELAAAVERRDAARGKLDERRRARMGECARAWRERAAVLERRIGETPAELTEARTVRVKQLGAPEGFVQRVRTVREWLRLEWAEAEKEAARLERNATVLEPDRLEAAVAGLTWPEDDDDDGGGDAA